jgi:hypothetical protein
VKRGGLTRLAVAVFAGFLAARPATGTEPWAERVITRHVDQATLSGRLDGDALARLRATGAHLFTGRFTALDGVGRPFATQAIIPTKRKRQPETAFSRTSGMDSNACSSCHNQPVTGGAGDFVTNVFVSEGFESFDFDSTDPQFSNERGTNHLFGAGLIELLAREITAELKAIRGAALAEARTTGAPATRALAAKGIDYGTITAHPDGVLDMAGITGVDADLTVRPFSQKGVMTSLRQFTVNALNHHHGMQPQERFGRRWTGERDHDGDGHDDEISAGDKPFLPLTSLDFADPGPLDMAGTLRAGDVEKGATYDLALLEWTKRLPRNAKGEIMVPLFGDLKRHRIADRQVAVLGNELLAQRFVERNVFMTAELWGVGSTDPYGHRNDLPSLDSVIRAHGGDARAARDNYLALGETERSALIAFLRTLVIEPASAEP